jgi:hypothetical protein
MFASNTSTFNLQSIIEKEKLSGMNFIDWYRNLRIVLRQEEKEYVLEQQYPDDLPMVQLLQPAELMRSTAMIRSMSAVLCLPPCPLIYRSSMSMPMLTP